MLRVARAARALSSGQGAASAQETLRRLCASCRFFDKKCRRDAAALLCECGGPSDRIYVVGALARRVLSLMTAWPKVARRRPAGTGEACKMTSHAAAEHSGPVVMDGEAASDQSRDAPATSLESRLRLVTHRTREMLAARRRGLQS